MPVTLAQGSPLCFVPEDGHPARGLGLIELHLGTARVGLHPADGGRRGRVWGQGTAVTQEELGTGAWRAAGSIQHPLAPCRGGEKGRAGAWRVFRQLLKMVISAQSFVLSPLEEAGDSQCLLQKENNRGRAVKASWGPLCPLCPFTGHCNAELGHSQICPGDPAGAGTALRLRSCTTAAVRGVWLIWGAQTKDHSSDQVLWELRKEQAP